MESKIENSLSSPSFTTQTELKAFVKKMQSMMSIYEQTLYDQDRVTNSSQELVRGWRKTLLQIIKDNKELPEDNQVTNEDKEGLKTVRMVDQQLQLAESNQKTLEKSTLKLMGLDYSSNDIEKAILEAKKKLERSKRDERTEKRKIFLAFAFFISVCLFILIDKVRILIFKK